MSCHAACLAADPEISYGVAISQYKSMLRNLPFRFKWHLLQECHPTGRRMARDSWYGDDLGRHGNRGAPPIVCQPLSAPNAETPVR